MRRYPNGIAEKSFFQKEAPESIPDWVQRARVFSDERGGEMDYVMAQDRASLLFLTNLGCIDHNRGPAATITRIIPTTSFLILIPPQTRLSPPFCVSRAQFTKSCSLPSWSAFLRLRAPRDFTSSCPGANLQIRSDAHLRRNHQPARRLRAARDTTLERSIRKRPAGRVLLDALQNAKGKPLAAVYSARAHPGATVSTPVTGDELMNGNIDPTHGRSILCQRDCNRRAICGRIFGRNGRLWTPRWKH